MPVRSKTRREELGLVARSMTVESNVRLQCAGLRSVAAVVSAALVEQQWELSTICDSSHGRFETRSRPTLTRRYPHDFTFYLGNPIPRLFVCRYIA